jgi:lambda repressor-like predicted transcriptional regulator
MKIDKDKLENELKKRGLKKEWVAKQLNMSRQTFANMLNRKTLKGVEKLAEFLDMDPKDLII